GDDAMSRCAAKPAYNRRPRRVYLPAELTSSQLRDLARRGAEVRLRELLEEKRQIETLLGTWGRRAVSSDSGEPRPAARRRRRMSAAQRKAVGERMRKYWAASGTEARK